MSALRKGWHRFHAALLLPWFAVTFGVLPSEISAALSCGTSQEDGDRARSCSSTENHRFGGLDELDSYAVDQANIFKSMERPDVPLEAWESERFAFEDGRAAEFEALRRDTYPCDLQVPRRHISEITPESFREEFERASKPVIISGIPEAMGWEATTRWTWEGLAANFSDLDVRVTVDSEGKDLSMKLGNFLRYARTQTDDSPLYVFEGRFVNLSKELRMDGDYAVPDLFPEDLFSVTGEKRRPPYRWFLVGPKRSGSGIHIDPLGTSAWNTLLSGRKLWMVSPPGTKKVLKDPAQGNGTDTSIDLAADEDDDEDDDDGYGEDEDYDDDDDLGPEDFSKEAAHYFLNKLPGVREKVGNSIELYLTVQHPGETIFVPSGWVHGVLNLDDTIAVTQNFVSSVNFDQAWRVSRKGRPQFAMFWLQSLLASRPDLVSRALELNEEDDFDFLDVTETDGEEFSSPMTEVEGEDDDFDDDEGFDDDDDDDDDDDYYTLDLRDADGHGTGNDGDDAW